MEIPDATHSPTYKPAQRVWLIISFFITATLSLIPFFWLYQKIQTSIGKDAAEIGVTVEVIFLLAWITLGIFAGYKTDQMIRRQISIPKQPEENKWIKMLIRVWGYEKLHQEDSSIDVRTSLSPEKMDLDVAYDDIMNAVNQPNRRGRPPEFSLKDWVRVAIVWESRDTTVDARRLSDVISEILGTNPDGSPIMSEQSYYKTWRPRAKKELERLAKLKKNRYSTTNK